MQRSNGSGRYSIVVGGRRLKALQLLKADTVAVRLVDTLSDVELREIESEENDDRKDFTQRERGRTFKAAENDFADVKKAAELLSTKLVDKPKSRGHKPPHGVSKKEIAAAIGVSTSAVVRTEQHVQTAEAFPFMQGSDWREARAPRGCSRLPDRPATAPR